MSKVLRVVLLLYFTLILLAAASCVSQSSYTSQSQQPRELATRSVTTKPIAVQGVVVKHVSGYSPESGQQTAVQIAQDSKNNIAFIVRVVPANPPSGQSLTISLQVSSKKGYMYGSPVNVSWTSRELTKPTPPSVSERDQRVINAHASALAAWPPARTAMLLLPTYDTDVAGVLLGLEESLAYMVKADWMHFGFKNIETRVAPNITMLPISGMQDIFDTYVTVITSVVQEPAVNYTPVSAEQYKAFYSYKAMLTPSDTMYASSVFEIASKKLAIDQDARLLSVKWLSASAGQIIVRFTAQASLDGPRTWDITPDSVMISKDGKQTTSITPTTVSLALSGGQSKDVTFSFTPNIAPNALELSCLLSQATGR